MPATRENSPPSIDALPRVGGQYLVEVEASRMSDEMRSISVDICWVVLDVRHIDLDVHSRELDARYVAPDVWVIDVDGR
jgi:hypothetical protein